ncbi:MAG: sodium:alanine symporter family protein [Chromatiales bacterium]|jgi:AGCS family alanine or glycine:cation symporter|nr:MAG: sodium:alanine symporter family protein [Chromatiales bacterium]
MTPFDRFLETANAFLWQNTVLFVILATGIVFTIWTRFCQFRALTHGVQVIRGKYDRASDPGAITHFQALSAALSATVGLGNIGGVAMAISLGGPGAVFWMWVVGFFGMALKTTEVTLAMLYRNTDNPDNPHGGTMWVISKALAEHSPGLGQLGKLIGGLFCLTLLVMVVTGGNMFQAWNVGNITHSYFGVPTVVTGMALAVVVGLVIIGGIRRIGAVASRLVPFMVLVYLCAAVYVLTVHATEIPAMFALIFRSAFSPAQASGAFIGGTMGYAFMYGMKRAIFSNEAGQGTSPIAHSAAKTNEPVREATVAGLEPFIDTIVVCTLTALVIIVTGTWNRPPEAALDADVHPVLVSPGVWTLPEQAAPARLTGEWSGTESVFAVVRGDPNPQSGNDLHKLRGSVELADSGPVLRWSTLASRLEPDLKDGGVYVVYVGATLTAVAFDSVLPGLGRWIVTLAAWLFAISTMISYSYYAEQGVVFLGGERWLKPFKVLYCGLAVVSTLGFLNTDAQLDNLSGLGTGLMLFVNIPVMWFLGRRAMDAYRDYMVRLDRGDFRPPA